MPYQNLKSYQQAIIIHDFTEKFCQKFIDKKSRTYDQMVQAARSGKQNIVEGSANSEIKPKSEIYLLSIASASLKELLEDYKDYLRQKGFEIWVKDDLRAVEARQLVYRIDMTDRSDRTDMSDKFDRTDKFDKSDRVDRTDRVDDINKIKDIYEIYKLYLSNSEEAANVMICLINQTTYLLDQQIKAIEKQMAEKGIFKESREQRMRSLWNKKREQVKMFDKKLQEIIDGKRKNLDN